MAQRVYRLSPHRNGVVMAVVGAFVSLLFSLAVVLVSIFTHGVTITGIEDLEIILLAPVFYFFVGYLVTAIACVTYNWLYSKKGGLELEIRDEASNDAIEQPRAGEF